MFTSYGNTIRDDAYGYNTDSPDCWQDHFSPKNKECEMAKEKFEKAKYEILEDIADDFGLDTSEWDQSDYWDFMEIVGL